MNVNVSSPVMRQPAHSGTRGKSRLIAIAEPTTSWMSEPMTATSMFTYTALDTQRG